MIQVFRSSMMRSSIFGIVLLAAFSIVPNSSLATEHGDSATTATAPAGHDEGSAEATAHAEDGEEHGASHGASQGDDHGEDHHAAPHVFWSIPFVILLLCIAILPLIPSTHDWWERNQSKLLVAIVLGTITCLYYALRGWGFHDAEPGVPTVLSMLSHAVVLDYIPFIVLLFSLFTISGGIYLSGDIAAYPRINVALIFMGALLASFIGTTGASMLFIRPLLQINSERRYVKHTVIFFIFLVSNIGGSLLPIGDPPLFLGYLRGVPFLWTFTLAPQWITCIVLVLGIYWLVDKYYYSKETMRDIIEDVTHTTPIEFRGGLNLVLLGGVILAVALLVPGKTLPFSEIVVPDLYLREFAQLALAGLSMLLTSKEIRVKNAFSFFAIAEVACLFIGIFVTMQVPIEILNARGAELGLTSPAQYFWATGGLSAFLDNAPTYVVFFQTAGTLPAAEGVAMMDGLATSTGSISIPLLTAISLGSVFMGAMTYIGNGPNFMVKSIAVGYGVKMPSFFGYMAYSCVILLPVLVVITLIFLR